mmetsp:Transcript_47726/g.70651  ORF Transcript_47726/g.70651 Transcript_47726/m.70651 type:complete len:387 (+) Transcript_47726:66-1226(+)|eukprot:CAMPEP_0195518562 /NCGR_PEP_ID=MMETSP0794_2-20130614/13156_1 /TAXON_ID=515487 /ORGANISM="Stephanopyxis turris, Strain CCMP 815" /LENGTH=386 /DNA_ID=CAMNT_0040647553 /DNA_START=66 /DNA_END=1226 /DNA_ORIENTATION=-
MSFNAAPRSSSSSTSTNNNAPETHSLLSPNKATIDAKKNDDSNASTFPCNQQLTLRIKCNSPDISPPTSGSDWYEVCTDQSANVKNLKESVRNAIGASARGRYLRLIASGRLLAPDVAPLRNFKMNDDDYIHAVIAPAGVRGGHQAAMARNSPASGNGRENENNGFRSVGISATGLILPQISNSDESDDDLEAGDERTGFDRLRSTGLTRDEISAIRLHFSQEVERFAESRRARNSTNNADIDENTEDSDDEEDSDNSSSLDQELQRRRQRLRLEDEWMDAQGPTSEFRLNIQSDNPLLNRNFFAATDSPLWVSRSQNMVGSERDFMWGFFLGFFVGFVMLFWVWMPTVPHKQKLGILTGISCHLALNMLRPTGYNNDEDIAPDGG